MKQIVDKARQMSLFEKAQILSAFIPFYSCIFVIAATYVICWKKKLNFLPYIVCAFIYFISTSLVYNLDIMMLVKYIIGTVIAFVGNYALVSIQMKDKQNSDLS